MQDHRVCLYVPIFGLKQNVEIKELAGGGENYVSLNAKKECKHRTFHDLVKKRTKDGTRKNEKK